MPTSLEPGSDLDRCYRILGLPSDATIHEIRTTFRRLATEYHPDRNNSQEAARKFATISAAYDTIVNSQNVLDIARKPDDKGDGLDLERGTMTFTIMTEVEKFYHVSPGRFESEVRKHFNPMLAPGRYCKIGNRWFEIDADGRSAFSIFRRGPGKGYGLIEWSKGPKEQDVWTPITWDAFWTYVRRSASLYVPKQEH